MTSQRAEIDDSRAWPGRLTALAFFACVVLLIARVLALETLRDPFEVTPGTEIVPRTLTASAALMLDWLALVPALLVLLRRVIESRFRLVHAWSFVALALLAIVAGASAIWSNDRFVAVIGSAHFIAAAVLLWTMAQVVRDTVRLRILAGACLGLMLALVAYGLIYRFIDLPENQHELEKNWPSVVQQHGWDPGSYIARAFHQKLLAGETTGFSASPNTYAAIVIVLAIVAAGIAIQRITNRDSPGWWILIALTFPLAAWSVYFAQSKTAAATPILAAICFVGLLVGRSIIVRYHRALFAASLIAILALAVGLIALGLVHHSLLSASLTFRWWYWTGSMRLIRAHPWLGVGWNNFADHYLAVREAISSEEIKDPHNLVVRIACELGVVGAGLLVAWLVRMWWEMTRPRPEIQPAETNFGMRPLPLLVWLAAAGVAVNVFASVDRSVDLSWVFLEILKRLLFGGLILVGLVLAVFRSFDRQIADDRPARWIASGILIALGIFLVHNAIDFSFFETGPMWVFMCLAGAMMGVRADQSHETSRSRRGAIAALLGAVALCLAALVAIVLPVMVAESSAQAGDDAIRRGDPAAAVQDFNDAFASLPFSNPDYLYRAARAQLLARASTDDIRETLSRALSINPLSGAALALRAKFEAQLPDPDPARVTAAFDAMLGQDPNDANMRILYGDALVRLGRPADAITQYKLALDRNSKLEEHDPRRLDPADVDRLQEKIVAPR